MAAPKIAKSAPMARKPPVAAFSFMTHDRFMIAPSPLNLPVTRLARGFEIALLPRHRRRAVTYLNEEAILVPLSFMPSGVPCSKTCPHFDQNGDTWAPLVACWKRGDVWIKIAKWNLR